jgi:hypothetical protein
LTVHQQRPTKGHTITPSQKINPPNHQTNTAHSTIKPFPNTSQYRPHREQRHRSRTKKTRNNYRRSNRESINNEKERSRGRQEEDPEKQKSLSKWKNFIADHKKSAKTERREKASERISAVCFFLLCVLINYFQSRRCGDDEFDASHFVLLRIPETRERNKHTQTQLIIFN